MNKISMRLLPVACAAGLLLSACGGGGDSGPAPTSPGITATTYQEVAGSVSDSMLAVMAAADGLRGISSLEGIQAAGQISSIPADPVGLLRRLLDQGASGREQAQATQTKPVSCPDGGYVDGSVSDADNNGRLSRGDSANLQFHGCVVDGMPINGALGISVTGYSASSGSLSLSFNGLSADGATLSGGAAVSFAIGTVNTLSISLSDATFNDGGTAVRANYTVDVATSTGSSSVAVHGNVGVNGHDYVLTQPTSFTKLVGGSLQPGGVLQIREAAFGERVLVKADTGRFIYQYFSAGNTGSTPDASSTSAAY